MWIDDYCKLCLIYSRTKDLVELGCSSKLPSLLRYLAEALAMNSRSLAFTESFNYLKELVESEDPYVARKNELRKVGVELAGSARRYLESANWSVKEALRISAAANIIDTSVLGYQFNGDLSRVMWDKPIVEELINLPKGEVIYLIPDNAGEVELDKLLAEALVRNGHNVAIVVRESSYEIDVTAQDLGNEVSIPVIRTPGNRSPVMFIDSGFIIAKGIANAEAYLEFGMVNSLHLFRAKCDVISRYIGVPKNSAIIISGESLRKLLSRSSSITLN